MPWPVHPNGLLGAQGDNDTYRIERSLRFNSADSAYLARTTSASFTSQRIFTFSFWCKRSTLSSAQSIFDRNQASNTNQFAVGFNANDTFAIAARTSGTTTVSLNLTTSAVFRDTSAWYHFMISVDNTQAVLGDRGKIYVNGVLQSLGTQTATQNVDYHLLTGLTYDIGRTAITNSQYFNGYIAEFNFIDGQALTPSSFGETDATTGRWKAKAFAGTYGTNGFYLKFADNSSTAALGTDSSGNGNTWTPNNFSVTAGAGNDSLVDSPTNYGGDTGVGGEVRGNYCTWNSLVPGDSASNGNLDVTNDTARGNQELMKYNSYWEVTSTGGTCLAGIISTAATSTVTVGSAKTFGFKLSQGGVFEYANVTDGSSFTSQATAVTPPIVFASTGASITASLNAGQRQFVATAPTGFKALCTQNLKTPIIGKPNSYMDAVTFTATGADQTITGFNFSPDFVWIKNRANWVGNRHTLYDVIRGVSQRLDSSTTEAEAADNDLFSFNSNGFSGNLSGTTYVAWAWNESPIAGMDIVSFTGTGATQNVSHNLGVAPKMVIYKCRNTAVTSWVVGHSSVNSGSSPWNYYLVLNATDAQAASSAAWNNTAPTSSQFTVGGGFTPNTFTYIAYCFAEVEGFSKIGSYTGNGSANGPFVYCGFRPRWVLVKSSSSAQGWQIIDASRSQSNVATQVLQANSANAENTVTSIDIISNGFKIRSDGASLGINTSSATYIFAAFAESPFKYARAR